MLPSRVCLLASASDFAPVSALRPHPPGLCALLRRRSPRWAVPAGAPTVAAATAVVAAVAAVTAAATTNPPHYHRHRSGPWLPPP